MKTFHKSIILCLLLGLIQIIFVGCNSIEKTININDKETKEITEIKTNSPETLILNSIWTSSFRENTHSVPELIQVLSKNINLNELEDFNNCVQNSLLSQKGDLPNKNIKSIFIHQFDYERGDRIEKRRKFVEIKLSDMYSYIKEIKEDWEYNSSEVYTSKVNDYLLDEFGGKDWHVFKKQNQNSILNNGGAVVKCGENTYYITDNLAYEDYRCDGALYSVNPKGISRKIANIGGRHIWTFGENLYVSSDNSAPSSTFEVNPSNGKKTLLFNGTIEYSDADNKTLYFTSPVKSVKEVYKFGGLYKFDLNTSKSEKIFDANNTIFCKYLTVIDEKMYYYTLTKDNTVSINCYDMKSDETTVITTDRPDSDISHEEYSYTIPQLSVCGEWLIYSVGSFEGSGAYFYGNMYRIKPDGTDKASMNISSTGNFLAYDNWIYYTDSNQEIGCPSNIIHPDLSGKQKMNDSITPITLTDDGWLFYNEKNGDIHRSRINGNNDSLILKADQLHNYLTKDDHYNYTLDFVGDMVYINAEAWGPRSGGSWRDQFVCSSFNRVNINGKDFQTFAQINGPYSDH